MNEDKDKFNLITQPWIPCRMIGGSPSKIEYYGIEQTLIKAHEISEIIGDNPLVTISLHRLLLAVLYRCYGSLSYNGEWQQVWQKGDGQFDAILVKGYLYNECYGVKRINIFDRFYLFHNDYSFYQDKNTVAPSEGKNYSAKLFFHDEGSALFFEHRVPAETSLAPAEAARLLIAFQSFDVRGTKTPEPGQKQKGISSSPLLFAAVGLAKGRNLFETLMLNLYWDDTDFFKDHQQQKDFPVWEREGEFNAEPRVPVGYLDLLTWQSRRLKLFRRKGEETVSQFVIMAGEKWPGDFKTKDQDSKGDEGQPRFKRESKEPMIAFKKRKETGYQPVNFQAGRMLWRDSQAIFQKVKDQDDGHGHSMLLLNWLTNLAALGAIENDREIPLDFLGMITKDASPLFWRHERLPLPVRYLNNEDLMDELEEALRLAEDAARFLVGSVRRFVLQILLPESLGNNRAYFRPLPNPTEEQTAEKLQLKLEKDNPKKGLTKIINARVEAFSPGTHYWPRLENEFRLLLLGLARDLNSWPQQRERWQKAVKRAAETAMQEVISGTADSTRTLRAAAIAQGWFEGKFYKRCDNYLLGVGTDDEPDDADTADDNDELEDEA
ncbi:MAG: type I-E CRISPR-associated protein Cse1/CasA [Acidobacteria bacterium]|nr:type I-E CRISPR-associated protein Cse1/CasA [Acidobacteriota bacterium]